MCCDTRRGKRMSKKNAWKARKNWEVEFSNMTRGNDDTCKPKRVSKSERDWTIWTVEELSGSL